MTLSSIRRGGAYFRVADPDWEDPLDGSYAQTSGGRWNADTSFPVVYLSATIDVARANVLRRFHGQPFSVMDLREDRRPVLVETRVPKDDYIDIVTDAGCIGAGLPRTYPIDASGGGVPWSACQPVGQKAWDQGSSGIAARSAALAPPVVGEELAWFQRDEAALVPSIQKAFQDWFPGGTGDAGPPRG